MSQISAALLGDLNELNSLYSICATRVNVEFIKYHFRI